MTISQYTTKDGVTYIKAIRQHRLKTLQKSFRVPKNPTEEQLQAIKQKALEFDLGAFPHPKVDFLKWYWSRGKPKCITLDRTNLRLTIQKTLVNGIKADKPLRKSVGINSVGTTEAVRLVSGWFWEFHQNELSHVDRLKFEVKLLTWLTRVYTE